MSYFSYVEEKPLSGWLGCGAECNCSRCDSAVRGLNEWYEKEEAEPEAESPKSQPTPGSSPPSPPLSGWSRSGFGFGGSPDVQFFSQAPGTATLIYPRVNAQLPSSGPGYSAYYQAGKSGLPDDPPGYHRYAIPEVIQAIQLIAAQWQRQHPQGPRMGIGDISLLGGGPTPRHGAHQRGLEVDIRLPRSDGREIGATYRDPNYSRGLTQELVNLIRGNPVLSVRVILFNDPEVRGVAPYAGHDNHLHVGFLPPGAVPTSRPRRPITRRAVRTTRPGTVPGNGRVSSEIVRKTNEIFYARHPELAGRTIRPDQRHLATEWIAIRDSLLRGSAPH